MLDRCQKQKAAAIAAASEEYEIASAENAKRTQKRVALCAVRRNPSAIGRRAAGW